MGTADRTKERRVNARRERARVIEVWIADELDVCELGPRVAAALAIPERPVVVIYEPLAVFGKVFE